MSYIMGIDQGSSKTQVIIGDDTGNVKGLGKAYGACHSSSSLNYSLGAVLQAAEEAFLQSGISAGDVSVIYAGMTGIDWDYEADLLRNELLKLYHVKNTFVVNDCIIAMRAGTKNDYGAVLCAGSGLNCALRSPSGEQFIYGFYIDEEFQGGSALGRACVRAVIDAEIGMGNPTLLKELLFNYFQIKTTDDLLYLRSTNRITLRQYLRLPMLLTEAAGKGDSVAKDILTCFGEQFGRYISRGLKKLNMLDISVETVLSGSIFKCREPELKAGVLKVLKQEAPLAEAVDAVFEPIVGAYLAGTGILHPPEEDFYYSLRDCSTKYALKRI